MARKAREMELPAVIEPAADVVRQDIQALDQVAVLRRTQDSALEVGRLAGRIESMLFLRSVADRVVAETFIQIREGKKYKDLLADDGNGNLRPVADLPEACDRLFGKSYRTCAELAQNYELLGSDLYDKAQQIGLQTKDYRAIRALPADDQALVQQTIETAADREDVADLISEIVERNARKLAEKDKKIADLEATLKAREKVLSEKSTKLNEVSTDLEKLRSGTPDEVARLEAERELVAAKALQDAALALLGYINKYKVALADLLKEKTESRQTLGHETTRYLFQKLAEITEANHWMVDFQETVQPEWVAKMLADPEAIAS